MEPTNTLDEAIEIHGLETITTLLSDLKGLIKSNITNESTKTTPTSSPVYTNTPTVDCQLQDLSLLSDHTLIKFIIARQMNSDQAFDMLIKTYQWRQNANIDTFTQIIPNNCRGVLGIEDQDLDLFADDIPDTWQNFVPYLGGYPLYRFCWMILLGLGGCYHKTDRNGFPLYIERPGRIRPKELLENCNRELLVEFHL